ncbi:septum formation initiator family protein [Virgibacillus kekensis]|uniref:Septum formation initiator family protein n=1 Tax=Virgibacillus kekensis TaxID=202261 RepID=A0ABV9DIA0_9BACI
MSRKEKPITKIESSYVQQYDAYIERQKRKKKRLIRRLVLFSAVVVIVIGCLTTYHIQQRMLQEEKAQEYEQLQDKLATLEKEEKELKEEINLLKDEDYVLQIARTNYFFSKEGELIFKLPDDEHSY